MRFLSFFILFLVVCFSVPVFAQNKNEPTPPATLQNMVKQGAQVFFLGEFEGMNGWALVRKGQPEYFYENKDRTAIVMGLLFSEDGDMITMSQLKNLHDRVGDDMYAITGNPRIQTESESNTQDVTQKQEATAPSRPLTPAENMYLDLVAANWITMNPDGAHDVIAFIDPDCPHCRQFIKDAQNYFEGENSLRVHALPIGLRDESMRKAAMLLAASDPADRLKKYSEGDDTVLKAPQNIGLDAVKKNLSVMNKYRFNVTPVIVYKTKKGEVRLIRGRPASFENVINDIVQN